MTASNSLPAPAFSMTRVLLCGGLVVTLSMGIRHGFGLWLQPVTLTHGWSREAFSFAIAIQNLTWGLLGPFTGMIADRYGASRVLVAGGLLYALGLVLMATAATPLGFLGGVGWLMGFAQSGTTYAVIYGVIARNFPAERRSWAMGITAAAGSFGQFLMPPLDGALLAHFGWQDALFILACAALAILPLSLGVREPVQALRHSSQEQSVRQAMREAFSHRSFQWLTAGYFVCGFQLAFIGVHLPSYLRDKGVSASVAPVALALVGLFNIFGSYAAGVLGQRHSKPRLLSGIYLLRALAIAAFVAMPLSPISVYLFASAMGFLWLSTVPPTNAIVVQVFGARHMTMLGGFVFLSHQVGSFLGVWLGGRLYDATGSYTLMWWLSVGLGVCAALVNLPVRETPVLRAPEAAATAAA
ncbi:MAG TPA: MFS transporter [Burkholderiaceae bacterium]|nr:MFS transporter [Burkholderiaceae bacterium]